jgi:hypothetical protein
VFGPLSADGELMHARNFDFPGVGVWDKSPTIVYCTPDHGIPYGYLGARGADVPGITAFNAEGLTVTFHTRFHRDVDFKATGVIDLGMKLSALAHDRRCDQHREPAQGGVDLGHGGDIRQRKKCRSH